MFRSFRRLTPLFRPKPPVTWMGRRVATAAHPHHPNPGNFANRTHEELAAIGHRGGKKGGKARGVGGFHDMDPGKQHEIASKGGRAGRKAATEQQAAKEARRLETEYKWRSHEPSVVPPGFGEWKTSA